MRIWPPAVIRAHARRKAELAARAEAAEGEKQLSEFRLERMRREVTGPLYATGRRNGFAELIRDSLREGYRK